MSRRTLAVLWAPTLSSTTMSPGFSLRRRTRSRKVSKTSASVAPSTVIMARTPLRSRAPIIVVTVPALRGTVPWARSPRGARAYSRVMAMWLPASSMKTSRLGSRLFASSTKLRRRACIRGSPCSTAVRVFFSRERQLQQDSVHRRPADRATRPPVELPRDLLVGEVGLLSDDRTHDVVPVGRDAWRVTASSRPPHESPGLALQPLPAANGRLADLEQPCL